MGAKDLGSWNPTVNLPDAISCRGGGPAQEPFIECTLYRSSTEAEAAEKFEDILNILQAALPEWKLSRLNLFRAFFAKGKTSANPR